MSDSIHPALIAALASAAQGPTEGVHVRQACGFGTAERYVAEVTKMTPVGPIVTRAEAATPEDAVDAARDRQEARLIQMAPAGVRERLRNPEPEMKKLLEGLFGDDDVTTDGDEIPAPLRKLLELLPGDAEEESEAN